MHEMPSATVREVSQHVSWFTVICLLLVGNDFRMLFYNFAVYLLYFFFAAGIIVYRHVLISNLS